MLQLQFIPDSPIRPLGRALQGARCLRQAGTLCLLLAALAGCVSRRTVLPATVSEALSRPEQTRLGAQVAAQAGLHPGLSGVYVLDANIEAFQARAQLADAAQKTLDVQSHIILGDTTGRLLAQRILAAADRGVRVRILADDISLVFRDSWITRLDAHPNIQMRVFNPFLGARTSWFLILRDVAEAGRLTRRMHNKLFAADNAVAIMGGRNIGDEYYAARADLNFEDLDVLVAGPVVRDLSRSFDEYWNSEWAYPVRDWKSEREQDNDLQKIRKAARPGPVTPTQRLFSDVLARADLLERLDGGQLRLDWAKARVIYDRPDKVSGGTAQDSGIKVIPEIWSLIEDVRDELIVISPYFVPGEEGTALLCKLRRRGVRVRILTNSLGSTDTGLAQTGYTPYRRALLHEGIEIHELKPSAMSRPLDRRWLRRHATRPQSSLHAKAYVFDRKTVFVGSMNLDNRARYLNTELGLILDSPAVAGRIAALFEESALPQHSYRMALQPFLVLHSPRHVGEPVQEWPVWITEEMGRAVRYDHEPHVSVCRRLGTGFLALLPLESQL
jgi:cardiolipin synthase C